MKKIIKNKTYNTKTAKWCGEFWNGCGVNDCDYLVEELYLKKTGEFFLHRQRKGMQTIIPLTYLEARQWAEDFLTVEEYENTIGEIQEDDGWTSVHVHVQNNLVDEIEKEKQRSGLTLKDIVNDALTGYFNKKNL